MKTLVEKTWEKETLEGHEFKVVFRLTFPKGEEDRRALVKATILAGQVSPITFLPSMQNEFYDALEKEHAQAVARIALLEGQLSRVQAANDRLVQQLRKASDGD